MNDIQRITREQYYEINKPVDGMMRTTADDGFEVFNDGKWILIQESLGDKFAKVLCDNLDRLIEESNG